MKKEIKNRELTPELFRSIVRDDSIEMSMCTFDRTDNVYTNRSRTEISQTSKYIESQNQNQNQSRIPLSQSNPSHLTNTHPLYPITNTNTSTSTYNPIQSLPISPTKTKLFLTKSENQNLILTHSYQSDSLNVSNSGISVQVPSDSGISVQGPPLGLSTSTWIEDQYLLSDRAIMAALARTQMDIEKNRKNNLNSSFFNSSNCNYSNRNDGNNDRNNAKNNDRNDSRNNDRKNSLLSDNNNSFTFQGNNIQNRSNYPTQHDQQLESFDLRESMIFQNLNLNTNHSSINNDNNHNKNHEKNGNTDRNRNDYDNENRKNYENTTTNNNNNNNNNNNGKMINYVASSSAATAGSGILDRTLDQNSRPDHNISAIYFRSRIADFGKTSIGRNSKQKIELCNSSDQEVT